MYITAVGHLQQPGENESILAFDAVNYLRTAFGTNSGFNRDRFGLAAFIDKYFFTIQFRYDGAGGNDNGVADSCQIDFNFGKGTWNQRLPGIGDSGAGFDSTRAQFNL